MLTFEEVAKIGQGIMDKAAGQPIKRKTLLDELGLSDNQSTRDLISASFKYGITSGGKNAEHISLTTRGRDALDPKVPTKTRNEARFALAVGSVEPFNRLYEKFQASKMPSLQVMQDELDDIDQGDRAQCVDIFVQNIKFLGLLTTQEGAEFILRNEDALSKATGNAAQNVPQLGTGSSSLNAPSTTSEDYDSVCFFIAPIGEPDSEHRKHSDAILASYVEKALETVEPKLRVVRADKIEQPGMISRQVIEYVLRSRLVVADLSYRNPNVFYELCLRHVTGKPVIHLRRQDDPIPFDNGNFRTIEIKFADKFDILAELETVWSTIATFARQAIATGASTDNPVFAYCPEAKFSPSAVP